MPRVDGALHTAHHGEYDWCTKAVATQLLRLLRARSSTSPTSYLRRNTQTRFIYYTGINPPLEYAFFLCRNPRTYVWASILSRCYGTPKDVDLATPGHRFSTFRPTNIFF